MISTAMYNAMIRTFPPLIKQLSDAKQECRTTVRIEIEERLKQHYTDMIANNNLSWSHQKEYMSIYRHKSNKNSYCYTIHDNNQNIISSHTETTDNSPIVQDQNYELVLGGPDYSDVLQTTLDFASFINGV